MDERGFIREQEGNNFKAEIQDGTSVHSQSNLLYLFIFLLIQKWPTLLTYEQKINIMPEIDYILHRRSLLLIPIRVSLLILYGRKKISWFMALGNHSTWLSVENDFAVLSNFFKKDNFKLFFKFYLLFIIPV